MWNRASSAVHFNLTKFYSGLTELLQSLPMKNYCGFVFTALLLPLLIDAVDFDFNFKEKAREVVKNCRLVLKRPCPDQEGFVKFHLFTRQNKAASQVVKVTESEDNLSKTFFNPSHPNKVIIHGFSPRRYKAELQSVKDAYLTRGETNVWMVDWSKLAHGGTCIIFSLQNTDHVARCTAQLITAIERRAPQSSIHVIADRAGVRVAHRLAHEVTPLRFARITGLNPEGGIIPTGSDVNKLSSWDARFVDAIHSLPYLPTSEMFGHVDFYVNPSKLHQPGCEKEEKDKFVCDQRRALEYFAESITTKDGFFAWECSSYTLFALGTCNPHPPPQILGDSCPVTASGTYIVYTAKESPYALGQWEGSLYERKSPAMRNDVVSRYATNVKRNIELLEGKTPQIVKESGLVELLKSRLNHETEDLKAAAIQIGLKGIRALASHYLGKHLDDIDDLAQNEADLNKP